MHPTGETEWIFGRHKKRVNQIPVASKDVKSTQEMAVRNPNPYASQPLMSPSKQPQILFHTSDNCTTKYRESGAGMP